MFEIINELVELLGARKFPGVESCDDRSRFVHRVLEKRWVGGCAFIRSESSAAPQFSVLHWNG